MTRLCARQVVEEEGIKQLFQTYDELHRILKGEEKGFQPTALGTVGQVEVMDGEFIQILQTVNWICAPWETK